MSPKILSVLIASTVALIIAAPATANDRAEFSFKSYELDTAGGAQDLYKRLLKRARQICTPPGPRSLSERGSNAQCTQLLADEFVANINHQRINRIHNSEGLMRNAERRHIPAQ
jgi:UrcA family protein